MHVRTPKRKLKELGLKRRGGDFDKNLPADKAGDATFRFAGWLSLPVAYSPTKAPRLCPTKPGGHYNERN